VLEVPVVGHQLVQCLLAGVAEGGVAEVVGERDGLGDVLVGPQCPRECAGDLGDLQRVGQAGAEVVLLVGDEDLGLVVQAAEGGTVYDPVAVPLVAGAVGVFGLVVDPPAAVADAQGPPRQPTVLAVEVSL